jgi:lysophospholipase L1-like esterase
MIFGAHSLMQRWNVRYRVNWKLAHFARRVHGRGPLLVVIGDSLTDPASGSTLPWQVWLRIVAREGYKAVNLGVSGETTADMRRRIDQTLREGQPEIVVVFGGSNDAFRGIDPEETNRNVTFMVDWFRKRGIRKIVLIGPGLINWTYDADAVRELNEVRAVLGALAERQGVTFIDLAEWLRGRIDRGEDPDFSRVPYRQARSWHVREGDPHFNAYGQRLVAKAFLAATADWRRPGPRVRLVPLRRTI